MRAEGPVFSLDPNTQLLIRDSLLKSLSGYSKRKNLFPVFVASGEIRLGVFMILERELNTRHFAVISYEEIPQDVRLEFAAQAIMQKAEEEGVQ